MFGLAHAACKYQLGGGAGGIISLFAITPEHFCIHAYQPTSLHRDPHSQIATLSMGFFGKKKGESPSPSNKKQTSPHNKKPEVGSTEWVASLKRAAPPPPPQTVVRIVGDSKHITTISFDAEGKEIRQTAIEKLTPAELFEYGVTPSASSPSSNHNNVSKPPPPADFGSMPTASGGSMPSSDESMATIEMTRELVKGFIADIWNRGDIDLIEKICHPSLRFNGHVGMDRVGHDGFARMVTTVREALTDYHCEIHSMVVESNKAFCRLKFTGKHTGVLLGYPPTGKPVAWVGASEFTCKNGKILKVWELGDVKSLEMQLRSADV